MATKKKPAPKKSLPTPKKKAPQRKVGLEPKDQPQVEVLTAIPVFETPLAEPKPRYQRYSTRLGVRLIPDLKGEWVRFEDL